VRRPARSRSVDDLLAEARAGLIRLRPAQARQAVATGAVLVDIRPEAQRSAEGGIPGALVVERNVLEWRFDPASAARLPVASYELQPIIFCSEGYTSSLAAAALQDIGLLLATDLDGGFHAWRAAGLPVSPAIGTGHGHGPSSDSWTPAASSRACRGALAAELERPARFDLTAAGTRRAAAGLARPTPYFLASSATCSPMPRW
jgi:rhodanese-related sulfurtransferase